MTTLSMSSPSFYRQIQAAWCHAMHFRRRGQDFVQPNIKYDFNKRHFLARSLFYYV